MKKKTILNIAMVIAALVIVLAGFMIVRGIRGGGNKAENAQLPQVTVQAKTGNANIERSGVGYTLDKKTQLQDGDFVEILDDSLVTLGLENGSETILPEAAELRVHMLTKDADSAAAEVTAVPDPADLGGELVPGEARLELEAGEMLVTVPEEADLEDSPGACFTFSTAQGVFLLSPGTVAHISANTGSSALHVLSGSATEVLRGQQFDAGTSLSLVGQDSSASVDSTSLKLESLSDFALEQAEKAAGSFALVFTADDIAKVIQQRADEKAARDAAAIETEIVTDSGGSEEETLTCTITIVCDTILNNMDKLTEGKSGYVPANGVILATSTVQFADGDTAYDVLRAVCDAAGIQMEASYTPMYGSYYVQGINNLYEFDCGDESGWIYKVNGWAPNYGSSVYKVKNGDSFVWAYTCNGLGADVGVSF